VALFRIFAIIMRRDILGFRLIIIKAIIGFSISLNRLFLFKLIQITQFAEPDEIIEWNIAGWIERAIEISGSKNSSVVVTKSLAKNHGISEMVITWS
jgi:hypothetical protein